MWVGPYAQTYKLQTSNLIAGLFNVQMPTLNLKRLAESVNSEASWTFEAEVVLLWPSSAQRLMTQTFRVIKTNLFKVTYSTVGTSLFEKLLHHDSKPNTKTNTQTVLPNVWLVNIFMVKSPPYREKVASRRSLREVRVEKFSTRIHSTIVVGF